MALPEELAFVMDVKACSALKTLELEFRATFLLLQAEGGEGAAMFFLDRACVCQMIGCTGGETI
jgi:hypothetical protein